MISIILFPPGQALHQLGLLYLVDRDESAYRQDCSLHRTSLEGYRHTTGYRSGSSVPAEKSYSATEGECLVAISSLMNLRLSLLYEEVVVHTDDAARRWPLTM